MATTATNRLPAEARGSTVAACHPAWSRRRNGSAAAAALAIVALSAALISVAHYAGKEIEVEPATTADESIPVYLPNAEFLRFASLGYRNALADVLWFRSIDYFGRHYRSDRVYPWLARMCDIVTDLDPHAKHVYRFAGVILPWEANRPDDGIALLEKGLRVFPDSWHFHFLAGFNYFFFKNDIEKAIPHIRRATEIPGAHPFVSRLAAMLYSQQYGLETTRAFLEELRSSADSADMAGIIDEQLKQIQMAEDISALERDIRTYRARFGRLPASLDDLVREGLIPALPREPFGGSYAYDADTGSVKSTSGHPLPQIYTSSKRARVLQSQPRD